MNILVIDVGTSGMRGSLYKENGERIFEKKVQYQPVHLRNGEAEQSAREFEDALLLICRAFGARKDTLKAQVEAIAITAQRSSVIPVNASGKPLMNAIMWQDIRNRDIIGELKSYDNQIAAISGAGVNTVFSGGKMSWIRKKRPEIYKRTYKLLNIPEYLIHMMTGEYVTDYTYASRSNLMNIRKNKWDTELLRLFDIEEEKLCRMVEPGSVCGKITDEFSGQTGLKKGIPVISAGGDQQCAAAGQGVFKGGTISIVTGTGAFIAASADEVPDTLPPDMICNSASVKGKYIIEANVLTCCSAFDWFCRSFYDWEEIDYRKINRELENLYSQEEKCIVLPYFQGRSTPDWNPEATALISGLTLGASRENILKALVEGIFMEINNNIQAMRQWIEIKSAYLSGGLTRSRVMNQMQADIYGMPLYRLPDSQSASLGALMVTLVNMGVYNSVEEAFLQIRKPYDAENYSPVEKKYESYVKKQQYMNQIYNKFYKEGTCE